MAFALVQTSGDTIAVIDGFGTAQTINTWTGAAKVPPLPMNNFCRS